MFRFLNGVENEVLVAVASIRHPVLTVFARSVTDLGTISGILLLFGILYILGEKELGLRGAAFSILTAVVAASLKVLFRRDLPTGHLASGTPDFLIPYGFPSAHTAQAFFAATLLYYTVDSDDRYILPVVAGIIGLTRIYLGVHYPTDVVFGALLGAGFGLLAVMDRKNNNIFK